MRTSTIKSIAALALTGAGTALVFGFQTTDELAPVPGTARSTGTSTAGSTGGGGATATGAGAGSGSTGTSGSSGAGGSAGSGSGQGYADGTWTGAAIREPWGPFQVDVVVSNGKIVDVNVVRSPSDRHSSSINSRAVPILTQSVISSQGGSLDMVSGATWTSESYAESLQSALDQAAAA